MGNSRMNSQDWASYNSTHTAGKTRSQAFGVREMQDAYNPAKISVRESRDSAANPNSTPIILGCDVTGSMGMIADQLVRTDLIKIAEGIYDRKPIPDPHIAVLAIGDAETDRAPLQATQFEASVALGSQLQGLYLEGNGGGNDGESYSLAHLFAATKTVSDSIEKRGTKGVLITIGDEPIHDDIDGDHLARIMGAQFSQSMTKRQCVDLASQTYEVFHIVLANEGYASRGLRRVLETWNEILPQRVIQLADVTKLSEAIVSILQVINGERKEDVAASWGSGSSMVIFNAIKDLAVTKRNKGVSRLA
ncbi:hypothetical protein [Rhizobium sp. BK176]|uniref:hypothetical protein n=1 Tax=Rhizobium sp. BK176 TaxID=2587071 RepID=UPI0021676302|nr:hypothetical protein [Rhizobium sp. BK176]MCS4089928.1 hypothetical protein [Rhizobium sp. BK176]